MLSKLSSLIALFRQRLFTLSSGRKIGRFAIFLILCLDLQVLYLICDGTTQMEDMLPYPAEPVPDACRVFFKDFTDADPDAKVDFLRMTVFGADPDASLGALVSAGYRYENRKHTGIAPLCVEAQQRLQKLTTEKQISDHLADLARDKHAVQILDTEIDKLREAYNAALLEKIAGQNADQSILPADAAHIKSQIDDKMAAIATLRDTDRAHATAIITAPRVIELTNFAVDAHADETFDRLEKIRAHQLFFYPAKRLALGMVYLIPLLAAALFWHRRALKKDKPLQIIASAHLAFVFCIPLLFEIAHFLYRLLPRVFLARLMAWLTSWNLGFLWNYVVILASIALFGCVIALSQKFVFNAARRRKNRIKHKECVQCEERLPTSDAAFCGYCGAGQLTECRHCHGSFNKDLFHCPLCGTPNA